MICEKNFIQIESCSQIQLTFFFKVYSCVCTCKFNKCY